jgi:ABC-2 type transport system ATP-binding protein
LVPCTDSGTIEVLSAPRWTPAIGGPVTVHVHDPATSLSGTADHPQAVLRCAHLRKVYGDRVVVDDVSFEIARGETYGLLGPNGAGKTTVISMLAGLLRRDAGTVDVAGRPLDGDDRAAKAAIGLVPQDIALYPDLTARENLRFFGRLQNLDKATLARRIDEVLELIGLLERADDRVESFSGGMKRRCNIGVGLLHEPQLLVLDEPTVGVDPQSRHAILESIELLGGQGLSVLYTTHYMEEAERLCDRVGVIDEGRLVAEGTRAELIERVGEHSRIRIDATGDLAAFAAVCRAMPQVDRATATDTRVELVVAEPAHALGPVVEAATHAGVAMVSMSVVEPDLETVFLDLTGKALRDPS